MHAHAHATHPRAAPAGAQCARPGGPQGARSRLRRRRAVVGAQSGATLTNAAPVARVRGTHRESEPLQLIRNAEKARVARGRDHLHCMVISTTAIRR